MAAELSGDSAAVPRTKGKEFFSRVTQWRWRSCEPQDDNRSHHPSDLRRSTVRAGDAGWHGMCCMQDRLHACLIGETGMVDNFDVSLSSSFIRKKRQQERVWGFIYTIQEVQCFEVEV